LAHAEPARRYWSPFGSSSRASAKARMAPASDSRFVHKAQNLRHGLWDPLQPAGANLVAVDDLTALRVGPSVAQQVLQGHSRLRRKPYRGADCEDYGLSLWNNTGQRGLKPADDPQSHLVEPEAKLRSPNPADDLTLERVGVD
jgi:hypothetical protein